ncbi:MAG: hypothetical protein BZ138_03320 [Methanosphaera sp. rholeuAM270]|nr:MAG: hypothetical protein BZ138_03320 [Methanosphaera sp. rholeuAM270]
MLLLLLIPLIMLMIIVIDEYSHETYNTIKTLESEQIKSKTEDFENEIITTAKKSLHEVTLEVVTSKKSLTDSQKYLKEHIEMGIREKEVKYRKDNVYIDTKIKSVTPSENPFQIEISYRITSGTNNSDIKIVRDEKKRVSITDNKYPVYDPLPVLKTGATCTDGRILYQEKLANYINLENNDAYSNVIMPILIRECPFKDYKQHGNDNLTAINCLKNHYYHNSHDGMCLLCRLENRTSCNHYGFETFIVPTLEYDEAPVSIDHVLLNDNDSQYAGNKIKLNNQTLIYLDDGHKTKYGL